ncbi:MAG: hypothetical protein AAF685_16010 [Cyanobacteria bacterium P01_C01_bin.89]
MATVFASCMGCCDWGDDAGRGGGGGGAGRWLLGGGGGAGGRDGLAMGDIPLVLAPEKQMPVTDRLKG